MLNLRNARTLYVVTWSNEVAKAKVVLQRTPATPTSSEYRGVLSCPTGEAEPMRELVPRLPSLQAEPAIPVPASRTSKRQRQELGAVVVQRLDDC